MGENGRGKDWEGMFLGAGLWVEEEGATGQTMLRGGRIGGAGVHNILTP